MARSRESKFRMLAMQKVLPPDGQLKVFDRHQTQAKIQFNVAGHSAIHSIGNFFEGIHIAQSSAHRPVVRQVECRADRKLVLGIAAFTTGLVEVPTSWFQPDMLVQISIACLPPPPARHLISASQLRAVSLTFQAVANY